MSAQLISCIVPAYNGEPFLAETIESILSQSYRPLEVIVADDGSTDGTARVASGYGKAVRLVSQENAGPAAARNLGLNAANGDFIAFLDQDDLWLPEKLALQTARFRAVPELDVSVTHAQRFWAESLREQEERLRDHRLAKPLPAYLTSAMLTRRSAFDRVGLFDTTRRYGDSMEWFLRAQEAGLVIELLPDVLLMHRMHLDNLSRRKADESRGEFVEIIKRALDRRRTKSSKVEK